MAHSFEKSPGDVEQNVCGLPHLVSYLISVSFLKLFRVSKDSYLSCSQILPPSITCPHFISIYGKECILCKVSTQANRRVMWMPT